MIYRVHTLLRGFFIFLDACGFVNAGASGGLPVARETHLGFVNAGCDRPGSRGTGRPDISRFPTVDFSGGGGAATPNFRRKSTPHRPLRRAR
jgi:hypothetical protein